MSYIELEAFVNGKSATSKKAIKDAIKLDPKSVRFQSVASYFTPYQEFTADNVPDNGHSFTVTISPYVKRSAFGTVKRGKTGIAVVS